MFNEYISTTMITNSWLMIINIINHFIGRLIAIEEHFDMGLSQNCKWHQFMTFDNKRGYEKPDFMQWRSHSFRPLRLSRTKTRWKLDSDCSHLVGLSLCVYVLF